MLVYTSITLYFSFIVLMLIEFLFSLLHCKLPEVTLVILLSLQGPEVTMWVFNKYLRKNKRLTDK